MSVLHWGLCGCGIISNDFKIALDLLPEDVGGKHKVLAVAARSEERARDFAKTHGVERSYGSYEALIGDHDVHVVYVGTINSTHYEIGMKAIQAKKHVVIEKAMTLKSQHTRELYAAAEKAGVFVLDAMWTRFFPAARKVVELIQEGAIGDIMYFHADMAFAPADPKKWNVERLFSREMGGGALMDVGVYPLYFASMVFGGREPKYVKACGELNDRGVDRSLAINLHYDNGGMAQVACGFGFNTPREAVIVGTKGTIKVPFPFSTPTKILTKDKEFDFPNVSPELLTKLNHKSSWGLMYEAEEVRACIEARKKESECLTWKESTMLADIMEQIKEQIGLHFP